MPKKREKTDLSITEQRALLSVWRLKEDATPTKIRQALEETTSSHVALSTVYVSLVRLEKKKLVSSSWDEPAPVRGGKSNRVFRILPKGVKALQRSRQTMEALWDGLESTKEWKEAKA
jgi:PadR family transcriptional regulator PadR